MRLHKAQKWKTRDKKTRELNKEEIAQNPRLCGPCLKGTTECLTQRIKRHTVKFITVTEVETAKENTHPKAPRSKGADSNDVGSNRNQNP